MIPSGQATHVDYLWDDVYANLFLFTCLYTLRARNIVDIYFRRFRGFLRITRKKLISRELIFADLSEK